MNAPSPSKHPQSRHRDHAIAFVLSLFCLLTFMLTITMSVAASPIAHVNPSHAHRFDAPNNPLFYINHSPLTATEDVTYTLVISTLDPDQPSGGVILTMVHAPSWLWFKSFRGGAATFIGRPTNEAVGNHVISLELQRGSGLPTIQKFTITVLNTNDAPLFVTHPYATATLGQEYRYDISTEDPDAGDAFTLTVLSKPSWLAFTPTESGSGTLSGMVTQTDIETGPIVLQVQDAEGLSARQIFSITISTDPVTIGSVKGKITSGSLGVRDVAVSVYCHAVGEEVCLTVEYGRDVTDVGGNFGFGRLGVGQYELFFETPAGYTKIAPMIVSVKAGQVTTLPEIIITYKTFLPSLTP